MVPSFRITKENGLKRLKQSGEDFLIAFISGSNLHSNPKLYKYYWLIYSLESKENSAAAEVFYKKEHRLGAIFNYDKLIKEFPDIEFAPKYEDDNDESIEGGHK